MGDSSAPGRTTRPAGLTIQRLVAEHYQMLYRYAYRMAGNAADAEDLTQQTFLVAHDKLDQLREPNAARAWMCQILRTSFLKSRKRQRPRAAGDFELDWNQVVGETPDQSPFDSERLQATLDQMPEVFRVALLMFYFEEMSYEEIAAKLDIPLGTVMSRLSRAKSHLRQRLNHATT